MRQRVSPWDVGSVASWLSVSPSRYVLSTHLRRPSSLANGWGRGRARSTRQESRGLHIEGEWRDAVVAGRARVPPSRSHCGGVAPHRAPLAFFASGLPLLPILLLLRRRRALALVLFSALFASVLACLLDRPLYGALTWTRVVLKRATGAVCVRVRFRYVGGGCTRCRVDAWALPSAQATAVALPVSIVAGSAGSTA